MNRCGTAVTDYVPEHIADSYKLLQLQRTERIKLNSKLKIVTLRINLSVFEMSVLPLCASCVAHTHKGSLIHMETKLKDIDRPCKRLSWVLHG